MKQKTDFVTNSSSCSFIFVGWIFNKEEGKVKELMEMFGSKYDPEFSDSENIYEVYEIDNNNGPDIVIGDYDNGLNEDKIYVGNHNRVSEDDTMELSIQDIIDSNKEVKDKEGFDPKDIKIVSRIMMC